MASRYISRRYGGGVTSSSSSYSSTSLSSSESQSTNSYSCSSSYSTRARSQVSLVTGGDHGDHVVQVREAPPLPPASQWARARSCGPPGREREYYTEHSSSGMQTASWAGYGGRAGATTSQFLGSSVQRATRLSTPTVEPPRVFIYHRSTVN